MTQPTSTPFQTDAFIAAYTNTLLWFGDGVFEGRRVMLDSSEFEVSEQLYDRAEKDCTDFLALTRKLIPAGMEEKAGADLALSRFGFGSRFRLDRRQYGESQAVLLSKAASDMGLVCPYIASDRRVYC